MWQSVCCASVTLVTNGVIHIWTFGFCAIVASAILLLLRHDEVTSAQSHEEAADEMQHPRPFVRLA